MNCSDELQILHEVKQFKFCLHENVQMCKRI